MGFCALAERSLHRTELVMMKGLRRMNDVWQWVSAMLGTALAGCLLQMIRDDMKHFRHAATREELAAVTVKVDATSVSVAALSAEVVTTLRLMQTALGRIEGDIRELRERNET